MLIRMKLRLTEVGDWPLKSRDESLNGYSPDSPIRILNILVEGSDLRQQEGYSRARLRNILILGVSQSHHFGVTYCHISKILGYILRSGLSSLRLTRAQPNF